MIIGEDDSETAVHVDPEAPMAHQTAPDPNQPPQIDQQGNRVAAAVRTIWNPNIGRYAVMSDVGPAYATKREEAFNAFSLIMAKNPAAFQVIGDMWAKMADFPGADELADRLKRGLPPQYQDGQDPQVAQLQQQLQTVTQHAQNTLQQADAEVAALKGQVAQLQQQGKEKRAEIMIKDYEAATDRLKAVGDIDPAALKPIIRELVSQVLREPAVPIMMRHAEIDQQMEPPEPTTNGSGNA